MYWVFSVVDGDACAIKSEAEFNISLLVLFVIFGILGKNLDNDRAVARLLYQGGRQAVDRGPSKIFKIF